MIIDQELLDSAKSGKSRAGKRHLIKYLSGGKITRKQAMEAHCYDCSGMGESGFCELKSCSLYPYSPFKR